MTTQIQCFPCHKNYLQDNNKTIFYFQKKVIEKFESVDLIEAKDMLRPILITIALVWGNSKYYCTCERIAKLFELFHNAFIDCAIKTLEPDNIFQGDVDEAHNNTSAVIAICKYYKQIYDEIRIDLPKFRKQTDIIAQDWIWQPETVFHRLDTFVKRIEDLHVVFETGSEFVKLEKIIIGGLKGRSISNDIASVYNEWVTLYREWSNIHFNPLDPDPTSRDFEKESLKYIEQTDILERKLGFNFQKALLDNHDLVSGIQIVELCGTLLHRPIIKSQVFDEIIKLGLMFSKDLDIVKVLYDEYYAIYKKEGIKVSIQYKRVTSLSINYYREFRLT